ncbi:hypothetical protein T02_15722 [Trichinella nativa]|uniref:Uncharacterized protein n=1 Tax=Trichinella nativa TaxID=6335 RepID=A0A0V1KKM7_9BILA|nr:hypothetical protein T02_15722 [Trichinella nativa]
MRYLLNLPSLVQYFVVLGNCPSVTLSITSCSAERRFTAVKCVKNYFRSIMTEERLNGIAIMPSFWKNRCKIGKPWKGSAFVATTGKLYLFIRLTFLLSCHGNVKLGRKSSDVPYYFTTVLFGKRWRCVTKVQVQDVTYIQSSISNLRKPVFNATCAVSVFYANWAV